MASLARGNLARTPGILVLAVLGLLALSCATSGDGPTGVPDDTPEAAPAGMEVRTFRFEKGLHLLDEETRAHGSWGAPTHRPCRDLPEYARVWIQFIIDAPRDRVFRSSAAPFGRRLVLGNLGPRPIGQAVLCLRNGRPTVCGSAPAASRIPPATVDVVDLEIAAVIGDRIDVLIVPDNQVRRPAEGHRAAASRCSRVSGRSRRPAGSAPEAETERAWPWDGCGFARLLRDPPPWRESVRLPRKVERGADVFLLIERCPGPSGNAHPDTDRGRIAGHQVGGRGLGAGQSRWWVRPSSCAFVGKTSRRLHEFQVAVLREPFWVRRGTFCLV